MMTPAEQYEFDVNGYLLIEDAIDPDLFEQLNKRMDEIEADTVQKHGMEGLKKDPFVRFDDIINLEPVFVPLAANPVIVPYLKTMIDKPRLKSTWITYKWDGGGTGFHSNHTPTVTHNYYHYNGQIRNNLLAIFYAMKDIGPGEGALQVIPGSHKANFPIPNGSALEHMRVELPMKAGSALLFSHDLQHGSMNRSERVRRTIIYTYCPGVISNSYLGDTLYDGLFESSPEGSWQKYLLRRPNGFLETYPQPE